MPSVSLKQNLTFNRTHSLSSLIAGGPDIYCAPKYSYFPLIAVSSATWRAYQSLSNNSESQYLDLALNCLRVLREVTSGFFRRMLLKLHMADTICARRLHSLTLCPISIQIHYLVLLQLDRARLSQCENHVSHSNRRRA